MAPTQPPKNGTCKFPCMPLKPCERSLRNAVVPQRTPGCGPTFTIRAWSPGTVIRWESAPVSVATAVICLLSSRGWPNSLVMQDQMDVSALSRRVISPVGSTPIHPITGWPSLLPSSHSRTSIGLPCGSLSLTGDVRGYHVPSQSQPNGLGALCPPVALLPMTRKLGILVPATVPFWLKPSSTFGLFSVTMFIERSPGFAIPSILGPLRRGADRCIGPSRFRCQPVGCGSIVRRRCTSRYLPAHLRRIPLMGQRVVSWHHAKHNND